MFAVIEAFYWSLCGLVVYVYLAYPAIVTLLARARGRRRPPEHDATPSVTLIFCVHNERELIEAKLKNCRDLDYPGDRLEILAASDGSTDGSAESLKAAADSGLLRVRLQEARTGKTILLNHTVAMARSEILLFTDASTLLRRDAVRAHARHYTDGRVGCVGGELDFINASRGAVSSGHGLYWRYEAGIRAAESALGILAYVPGANYSMRRDLFRPVPGQYADDCVSPLNVVAAGRRVLYDPDAVAQEVASETRRGLFARRVRMVTRDLDATLAYRRLMNPWRHGGVALSLVSHKLLRWLVPVALLLILALNVALVGQALYAWMLALQILFYALAALAAFLDRPPRTPLLSIPLYFCVSNLGALRGLLNVALRRRIGIWQPVGTR